MFNLHIAVRTGDPIAEATGHTPGASLVVWCNFRYDILEIHAERPDAAASLETRLRALVETEVADLSGAAGPRRLAFSCPGTPRGSISSIAAAHSAIVLHPVIYEEGVEKYRVIALDDKQVGPLFTALKARGEVQVLSKRREDIRTLSELQILSPKEILGSLTPKQAEAILVSARHGYYQVPRRSSIETIARDQHVGRSAFQERVRKAESKIMAAVLPTLALMAQRQTDDVEGERRATT